MKLTMAMILAVIISALLTQRVRAWLVRHNILDVPNVRSSHGSPVPRGGGIAVAIVVIGGWLVLAVLHQISWLYAVTLTCGWGLLCIVGVIDDIRGLSARMRFVAQTAVAVATVTVLGGLPSLHVGALAISLGRWGTLLAVVALLWCVNLFNFMDGIDAIAGSEAISVACGAWILLVRGGGSGGSSVALYAVLIGATTGFLRWNWPPARIFLGDCGSAPLGYALAAIAVISERDSIGSLFRTLLLGSVFVFDATVTLARRASHGERLHEAHRQHAYQRAVQSGLTHAQVTLGVLALNFLLLGLALTFTPVPAAIVAFLGLLTVYLWVERRKPMTFSHEQPVIPSTPTG